MSRIVSDDELLRVFGEMADDDPDDAPNYTHRHIPSPAPLPMILGFDTNLFRPGMYLCIYIFAVGDCSDPVVTTGDFLREVTSMEGKICSHMYIGYLDKLLSNPTGKSMLAQKATPSQARQLAGGQDHFGDVYTYTSMIDIFGGHTGGLQSLVIMELVCTKI